MNGGISKNNKKVGLSAHFLYYFCISNNGGVHHISALVADPNTYKIHTRVPTSNGCYKATIYKNGTQMTPDKDFFPDDWDEYKVVDAIKGAFNNPDPGYTNNMVPFFGTYQGIKIKIVRDGANGPIKTAFPQ